MTGFKSKKAAALDEDGMYLVHQTASYADNLGKSIVALGKQTVKDIEQLKTQPEQEPVAWMSSDRAWMWSDYSKALAAVAHNPRLTLIPLYTAPPQRPWVYLTNEHIKEIVGPYGDMPIKGYTRELFDRIEAKSKELNT